MGEVEPPRPLQVMTWGPLQRDRFKGTAIPTCNCGACAHQPHFLGATLVGGRVGLGGKEMEAELPQDTPARPGHGPQSGELAKWQRAEEDGCGQRALAEAPGTPAVGRRGCGSQSGRCI